MIGVVRVALLVALVGVIAHPDQQIPTFSRTRTKTKSTRSEKHHRTLQDSYKDISTESTSKILFYSEWSSWSSCLDNCEQTRQRRCQSVEKCGDIVLKETRPCKNTNGVVKKKCAKQPLHPKHRHKHGDFHVVPRANVRETSSPPRRRRLPAFRVVPSNSSSGVLVRRRGRERQQSVVAGESAVIFPHTGATSQQPHRGRQPPSEQRHESKLYGKWSRWSQCTRSCTTQRRRLCKRRDLCGTDVIREAAYCYIEGSFCQRWIYRRIQQTEEENEFEEAGDYFWLDNTDDVWNVRPTTTAPPPVEPDVGDYTCGVAGKASSASRSLGNMLRIIGGRPTAKGKWPWQVAVLNRYREAFCGGTLVASRWVLTAAHCVRKRLYVRIGEHDLGEKEGTEMELRVEQAVIHPSYDAETVDNDVALLRLPSTVTPDRYRGFACLPSYRQPLPTAKYCVIIGWGKRISSDTFGTDVLHEAKVPIVSSDVCRSVYRDYHITNNMFCAGYRRGRMDSCAGDSGGPLLCEDEEQRWTVFGITSFGEGCGKKGKYGIYTKLANFVKWIQKTIKEKR